MTPPPVCAGILREVQNSPNRETDDRRILVAVLSELERAGARTSLLEPEELDGAELSGCDLILPMCEAYPRLKRLEGLAARHGPLLLNPPAAVLNCYRSRMAPLLAGQPAAGFPPSEIRAVADGPGRAPAASSGGWWVKRGDVHNTCDRDVVFIADWGGLRRVLDDFASREITHYLVQPHLPGDLIKFYGVGPGAWFTWFYHDAGAARRIPFEAGRLAGAAAAAASAVGLEVFGGDAIVSPGGAVSVIDINSWPSFARVRAEAAPRIAAHALARLRRAPAAMPGARRP